MRPRHLAALAGALALGGCSPYSDSEQQARLAGRLDDYAETLSATENEAKQSLLARQQLAFLEQDVFGVNFVAWHGRIEAIDETDGRYALTLWVEDHVKLRTWRGASSDDSANPTKFAPDSPLAPALAELEPCDIVRVSGTVLTESGLDGREGYGDGYGRTLAPSLIARFDALEKTADGSVFCHLGRFIDAWIAEREAEEEEDK